MRFIQVGVGGFGQTWLARLQRDRTASLVALVDVDPEALKAGRAATRLAASHCFSDYRAAFNEVQAEAVLNVTPPAVHHEVALAALERGLHVLVVTPLSFINHHFAGAEPGGWTKQ